MAGMVENCPRCKRDAKAIVAERIRSDGRLVWSRTLQCGDCGVVEEMDGFGFPPDSYREAMLISDGEWEVVVLEDKRASVALVAKDVLGLSAVDAVALSKGVPGPVWKGTKVEVDWLGRKLSEKGIGSTVQRCRIR